MAAPALSGSFEPDARAARGFLTTGEALLRRLPPRPARAGREQAGADAIADALNAARESFLRVHVEEVYDALTDGLAREFATSSWSTTRPSAFPA